MVCQPSNIKCTSDDGREATVGEAHERPKTTYAGADAQYREQQEAKAATERAVGGGLASGRSLADDENSPRGRD